MLIRNNNEKFGNGDVFEYASVDDAVSQMMPTLREWAKEKSVRNDTSEEEELRDLVAEFEASLEIIN